jgi:hypothetical protein
MQLDMCDTSILSRSFFLRIRIMLCYFSQLDEGRHLVLVLILEVIEFYFCNFMYFYHFFMHFINFVNF